MLFDAFGYVFGLPDICDWQLITEIINLMPDEDINSRSCKFRPLARRWPIVSGNIIGPSGLNHVFDNARTFRIAGRDENA